MNLKAKSIALSGMFTAVSFLIMGMGTIIPVATYTCPAVCILLLQMILKFCGNRIAWAHYGAVSILSLLFAPDKEAAIIYGIIGYYPIIKPWMEKRPAKALWKLGFFNAVILIAYCLMLRVIGLEQVVEDISDVGAALTLVLLLLGNVTFFLLDRLLSMRFTRKR